MDIHIKNKNYERLFEFFGYGRLDAPVWFLGMEEGTGGQEANNNHLDLRMTYSRPEMDLQEAHPHWHYWENSKLRLPRVWFWMATFIRHLELNHGLEKNDYIRRRLGRTAKDTGESFLLELLPLPKKAANDWPRIYQDNFYDSRTEYEKAIRPLKVQQIRQAFLENAQHVRYLFCYGMGNHQAYSEIAGIHHWDILDEKRLKIGKVGATSVILTPFWGSRPSHLTSKEGNRVIELLMETER